ncbi:MAG: pyridoxal-dependent decarboxylase [Microlunatus sp.]
MHQLDATTDRVISSILRYADYRLRTDDVPLDGRVRSSAELNHYLADLIGEQGRDPDEVLDLYTSVIAPTVLSADSTGFLGFIPAAPTKASLAFDALTSTASLQGISWAEASGVIAAENSVLRLIANEAGLPASAGGCFVSGGSAGNLSALAVAREVARSRSGTDHRAGPHAWRVVVGESAHSSVLCTLKLLEMEALVVPTPQHRLTAEAIAATLATQADPGTVAAIVATAGSANAGIIDDLAGIADLAQDLGIWLHVDGAYGGAGIFTPSVRSRLEGIERADSFIVDPHKWLFAPFDSCALLYRTPEIARTVHAQRAPYLEVLHAGGEWNPSDYAYHLTRRARGLPLWFSLAVHGVGAYREAIEASLHLARATAAIIKDTAGLELVCEPDLGVVLFRRLGWATTDYHDWSAALLDDQIAFVPPTTWDGETVARLAFLHPNTSMDTVKTVLARMW